MHRVAISKNKPIETGSLTWQQ